MLFLPWLVQDLIKDLNALNSLTILLLFFVGGGGVFFLICE